MFIGRKKELSEIKESLRSKSTSILIYGKRKVGKTTLILEALKNDSCKTVYYECIKADMEENIANFTQELVKLKILPAFLSFKSFEDAFAYLNSLEETFNIVIDEYPYLKADDSKGRTDSVFQRIIDNRITNIRLFISGSHIGMMTGLLEEKNALYGRFEKIIHLEELNYIEAAEFYSNATIYDKIALYSVFGGSPFVNNCIDSSKGLKENIISTLLNQYSPIHRYADNLLLSDWKANTNAHQLLCCLSNGKESYKRLEDKMHLSSNGLLSKQLKTLIQMELVSKTRPINATSDKKAFYEINDNILRFYYAYIFKGKSTLKTIGAESFYGSYIEKSLKTFISYRFEKILRDYFSILASSGRLKDVIDIGTYHYDDPQTKSNGEFDVALKMVNGKYRIIEAKYYSPGHPLSAKEMKTEEAQIRKIKRIDIESFAFCCTAGYDDAPEYDCIDPDGIYTAL